MEQQKQAQKLQQKKPSSLMSSIEETLSSSGGAKKRKGRSSSSSSSSSSDDSSSSKSKKSSSSSSSSSEDESPRKSTRQPDIGSDDFVSLTNSVRNRFVNGNYRSNNSDEIDQDVRSMPNFYKLSKTKQRKLIAQQNKKRAAANKAKMSALTISKPAKFAGFNSGGGGFETASAARKAFKNIFELQKDEMYDIEMQVEAAHKMHILTGYSQDLEKEYLRLTGVCHFS